MRETRGSLSGWRSVSSATSSSPDHLAQENLIVLFSDLTMHELKTMPKDLQLCTDMVNWSILLESSNLTQETVNFTFLIPPGHWCRLPRPVPVWGPRPDRRPDCGGHCPDPEGELPGDQCFCYNCCDPLPQVLNMHGKVVPMKPASLQKKRENKKAAALDSEQNPIQGRFVTRTST